MRCRTSAAPTVSTVDISSSRESLVAVLSISAISSEARGNERVKNKNRPRREKQRKRPGTRRDKPFNPWVYRYFDMTKTGESEDDKRRKKKMA